MSTDMRGIHQQSLLSRQLQFSIFVSEQSRYRILAQTLPWPELAEVVNNYRSMKIDINNGRPLDLRLHLGAYISQSMNGWTDRETEEMVRYHAGVRLLCGLEESSDSIDRTRIEGLRTMVGPKGCEALNQIIVRSAMGAGFTGTELCAADTTVQESPIAYPTEVGHMKNISEKLLGIGKKLRSAAANKMAELQKKAQEIFTEIRLFTKGTAEQALEKKKKLSLKLHNTVKEMAKLAKNNLESLSKSAKQKATEDISFFEHVLKQSLQWLKTGFHPKEKILSLWERSARAISKGKVGKSAEFGRRWIITRLTGGYVIGTPCQKLGADADTKIADEVMINFLDTFGEIPKAFVYDRGGYSTIHEQFLEDIGVEHNCIFGKGQKKMNVPDAVFEMARIERSLNESTIANIKHPKYNFTKPRARSTETCELKGHFALLGFNLNNLFRDIAQHLEVKAEIT